MRNWLIKFIPVLFSFFLLAGCQVASPINTTKDFLSAIQQNNWEKASGFLVANEGQSVQLLTGPQKQAWIKTNQEKLGKVTGFTVQNTVPLKEDQLAQLGSQEGYQVFFELQSQHQGSQHLDAVIVKHDNSWKLIAPVFET